MKTKARKLRELLAKDGVIMAPCAYDAISARMIEACGFDLVATSGYCVNAAMLGKPDVGLVAYNEMVDRLDQIANAVEIPILCDGESGYGNAINLMREVQDLEKRGVAGMFFDDQKFPPNCPWVKDMQVISTEEMVGKIKAAVHARTNPDFVIVARSDAPTFEEQIERCNAYMEAGADMVKISHMSKENVPKAPGLVKGPLHVGCSTGRGGPGNYTAFELGEMGYKIVAFIQAALFLNIKNTMQGLKKIKESGWQKPMLEDAYTMEEYFELIKIDQYRNLEKAFLTK
ncbi:MAG: oxaloacetate decarboxylase [Pyramidobacter sp.]|nr:oxaloacetate decarboxylase [Pyramidobacter sp.]